MRKTLIIFTAVLAVFVGALVFVSCASRSTRRPPQTAATVYSPADGGPPVVTPSGKGVIVPGDKATGGMVTTPSGATTSTGTNGQAVGPTLGGPTGGN